MTGRLAYITNQYNITLMALLAMMDWDLRGGHSRHLF